MITEENLERKSLFTELENAIVESDLQETDKSAFLKKLFSLKDRKVNVLIVGSTGCGKSSTINALFGRNVSKVGTSVHPETAEIEVHELDNLVIWDTPGLGDGKDNDEEHADIICDKLNETDEDGNALIDLVLVIIDGSTRDYGTTFELINKVIIPTLGKENCDRMLVAINQADLAMKGRFWDAEKAEPEEPLLRFLEEKAASVKQRIYEETGVETEPVFYSAGYTDEDGVQTKPYNIVKLVHYIVGKTSEEKRIVMADNLFRGIWAENGPFSKVMEFMKNLINGKGADEDDEDDDEEDDDDLIGAFEKGYAVGEKILGIPGGVVGGVVSGTVRIIKDIISVFF